MKREARQQLGVEMVPLNVTFNNMSHKDGKEGIRRKLFYRQLRAGTINPVTSQPSPAEFLKIFNRCKQEGSHVIYIGISSRSSGTLQAAQIAKNMCDYDRIHIVDSYQLSHGLEVLVRTAGTLRDKGETAAAIVAHLTDIIPKVKFLSVVDNLKYLVHGGRVQKGTALEEGRFSMKHIVAMVEGRFTPVAKARGRVAAFEKMYDMMNKDNVDDNHPIILTHADNREDMLLFEDFLRIKGFKQPFTYSEIGSVIGAHMGPGTVGIAYIAK